MSILLGHCRLLVGTLKDTEGLVVPGAWPSGKPTYFWLAQN